MDLLKLATSDEPKEENPKKDNIENEILDIEIYDMRGVLCKQQQGYLGEQIDVALLPSGLYTVVIKTQANEQVIKKLIKAN